MTNELRTVIFPKGWVYFVSTGDAIKIGWSAAPNTRLARLQTGNPQSLRFLGTVEGTKNDEHAIQEQFKHLRLRGEWFQTTPELLSFIEEVGATERLRRQMRLLHRDFIEWSKRQPDRLQCMCNSIATCLMYLSEGADDEQYRYSLVTNLENLKAERGRGVMGAV